MRILLIGEYSNTHWGLAEGLRSLGHEVCVLSNGDFWKNYKRDFSLTRTTYSKLEGIGYLLKTLALLPKLRNYDVVQLINPMFLELKAERIEPIYRFLKRHNKKIFLCAYGMDAYWVKACTQRPYIFRYSDFNIGDKAITNEYTQEQAKDWQDTPKAKLNKYIADDCNGIIAGMYEYHTAYAKEHADKLTYIPFPIEREEKSTSKFYTNDRKLKFFIGVQKTRSIYKGTDIMLRALERIAREFPAECEMLKAESVPFEEYSRMINDCDILLDQLYGYSPGMNALLALSKGKIVVGGAEEECYKILNETTLRPMINVTPNEDDVYEKLKWLVENKDKVAKLQHNSIAFIEKHHTQRKVAERFLDFWNSK